jgi:V/A-type H+-transporting ATPase subunit K
MGSELYFYFLLLPAVGTYFALRCLWSNYYSVLSDPALRLRQPRETTRRYEEPGLVERLSKLEIIGLVLRNLVAPGKTEREEALRQNFIIFASLALSLLGYGIIGFSVAQGKAANLEASRLVSTAGIALGTACLGAGLGMGFMGREAIRGIYSRPDSSPFYLILMALCEGVALYGMVVAFLVLGRAEGMSVIKANAVYDASLLFGALALVGGFSTGYLPTRIKGIANVENLTKKLIAAVIGESPLLIGFVYVFIALGRG